MFHACMYSKRADLAQDVIRTKRAANLECRNRICEFSEKRWRTWGFARREKLKMVEGREGGGGRLKREEQRQGKAHELVSTALCAQGKSATSSAERVV